MGIACVNGVGSKACVANRRTIAIAATRKTAAPRGRMAPNRMVRCDGFIGSPENVSVCFGTAIMLFACRFGFAPSSNRPSTIEKGLKLDDAPTDMISGDPAGMNFVDVLAAGSMGHIIGIGMLLGTKAMGGGTAPQFFG
mmetsp:Transcript_10207/g.25895  ORF Transcript_10207/g.25895 Transcript_10207/m.25895 type:complete len:139 (+) Transcript_10207:88-504(+)